VTVKPVVGEDEAVRILDRAEAAFDRGVLAARKRSRGFDRMWQAAGRFADVDGGRLAAAISYYGFFAAFSLAVVVYSVLGRLPGPTSGGLAGSVNKYLNDTVPWVATTAREVGSRELTAIGLVTLLITGVGWVEALRSSQRAVWLIDQHPGDWFVRHLVDLGMLVALGLSLGLSLAMTAAFDQLLAWIAGPTTTEAGRIGLRISGIGLELVVNLVVAVGLLAAVARLRLSPRRLVTPALVVAVGIQLLNTLGRWYIVRTVQRPTYQVVATAVGLLVYLYLLNQLVLFGAALAATGTAGSMTDLAAGPAPAPSAPAAIGPGWRTDGAGRAGHPEPDDVGEPQPRPGPQQP
jgi:membrane protein